MNKKLFLLLTGSAIALFFACSGEVVESIETSKKAELSLTVTVRDSVSGALLEADVSLNDDEPQQAKNGVAVFGNVNTGRHTLSAKIDGYAEMISQYTVEPVTGQNAQIPRDYATTLRLYPLTSSLLGYLRYRDENGVLKPVPANIEVKLRLNNDNILNKLYTAKTDANGKYTFNSLPAIGSNYTLWVSESKIGNINYGSTSITTTPSLQAAGSVWASETTLSNRTNLFVVSEYPSIIEYAYIANPIKFKFTEPVDRNRASNNSIAINPSSIAANITWNMDNTEVTLTPMSSWKGLKSVGLDLKSISGKSIADYYNITVLLADLSASTVVPVLLNDTNKIDWDSKIYLKYNKVPGATNYTIYTNNNIEGVYKSTEEYSPVIETDSSFTISLNSLKLFREVGILVQASNANSKTLLDTTKAIIKVKDNVKPTYPLRVEEGLYSGYSDDTLFIDPIRLSYYDNISSYIGTFLFSEPIQANDVVFQLFGETGGNPQAADRLLPVEREFSNNNREVKFKITIAGSATSTPGLKATLLIKNVKDLSGNPFEVQYINALGAPIANGKKDHVAIRVVN